MDEGITTVGGAEETAVPKLETGHDAVIGGAIVGAVGGAIVGAVGGAIVGAVGGGGTSAAAEDIVDTHDHTPAGPVSRPEATRPLTARPAGNPS